MAATLALAIVALAHEAQGAAVAPSAGGRATAVLAGGCFWGMEAVFERLRGVSNVVAGFSGGSAPSAHYEIVSTGMTGHAESVQITYDPKKISYAQILDVYFRVAHDPTERDRQGPDDGTQYRSEIFYATPAQARVAKATIARLDASHAFARPIVTLVAPLRAFYPAEAYHQHFVDRNPNYPYVVVNDLPKLAQLGRDFPKLVKPAASAADGDPAR